MNFILDLLRISNFSISLAYLLINNFILLNLLILFYLCI